MFIRRSTYRRLRARAEAYSQAYVDARRAENRKATPAAKRTKRLALACLRYRVELAEQRASYEAALRKQQRRTNLLQEQLDEVLGMNSDAATAVAK